MATAKITKAQTETKVIVIVPAKVTLELSIEEAILVKALIGATADREIGYLANKVYNVLSGVPTIHMFDTIKPNGHAFDHIKKAADEFGKTNN